ncbi:hypothetical protein EJ08DRAFT_634589 [Tothia fuscella]|uniref:Uncharacterized protein n=1 Tax=Tothia fuscella TaxID=1048955 RepID=A0A9P4NR71_9PEZI|nr:hypothetical protein EJ08DRAFT_634589 [Tothia fuscella]
MASLPPLSPLEGTVEMFSRGKPQPIFTIDTQLANRISQLSIVPELDTPSTLLELPEEQRFEKARPISEVTEIYGEDDDGDDENLSEFEEDSEGNSYDSEYDGRRSQTTISSFDEVQTPHSTRASTFLHAQRKSVEGPRGPHLFRASYSSVSSLDYALQLSPIISRHHDLRIDTAYTGTTPTTITSAAAFTTSAIQAWKEDSPRDSINDSPRTWSTSQVAFWMATSGIDAATVEKFDFHDISGAVLMDLEFHDLKELDIESFGKRHDVWNKICGLREGDGRISPVPTPFEDTSPKKYSHCKSSSRDNLCDATTTPNTPLAGRRRRRKYRRNGNEPITPAESVSIVAIEQLIPKPHKCEKGENCSKWKKQQRLLRRLHEEHGLPISPENGGHIFMTGDPGNAFQAPNILSHVRPASEAEPSVVGPSVVASSDLLGPGHYPHIALQEDSLRQLEQRDAQENVKQFLNFQHMEATSMGLPPMLAADDSAQEPLEMFPAFKPPQSTPMPLATLQTLPRLQIPRANSANGLIDMYTGVEMVADPFSAFSPCHTAIASPGGPYRFGTPATEMNVPLTAINLGPLSREVTQSVPPNMQYRDPVVQRASTTLPSLRENEVFSASVESSSSRRSSNTLDSDRSIPKEGSIRTSSSESIPDPRYEGVTHAGWMKKRKTKMLRHEWNDAHFRLRDNHLAMHRNDIPQSAILESLNIDQYSVGCSTIASNKLSTKIKALKIASGKERSTTGDAAFEFQLVPDLVHKGKTHHFAVKSKDERIDWMRELMLAKAMKAKRDGFEVELNGVGQ